MAAVLQATDPLGNRVVLHAERWRHIVERHPDMAGRLNELRAAIERPTLIQVKDPGVNPDELRYYYLTGQRGPYVLAIVKAWKPYQVWTAWVCRDVRKGGECLWLSRPGSE